MKRTNIALIVLAVTVIIVASGTIINIRMVDTITNDLETAISNIENGNKNNAEYYTRSAINSWESMLNILTMFNSHDKTDNIDRCLHIAETDLKNNETNLFLEEGQRTIILLRHLKDMEYPTPQNIL